MMPTSNPSFWKLNSQESGNTAKLLMAVFFDFRSNQVVYAFL